MEEGDHGTDEQEVKDWEDGVDEANFFVGNQ